MAAFGFAVPMSMPRYTMAESTLTITNGSRSTSATARSVLPTAVGPMRQTTLAPSPPTASASAPAHEQAVELGKAEPRPGGTAVVALPAALGALDVAQQGIHLVERQAPVRPDRCV